MMEASSSSAPRARSPVRSDKDAANFLALNLDHDIVRGEKSVKEAHRAIAVDSYCSSVAQWLSLCQYRHRAADFAWGILRMRMSLALAVLSIGLTIPVLISPSHTSRA